MNRRTLMSVTGFGIASVALSGCASVGCDQSDCVASAPLVRPNAIKQTGYVDAPITTSLAHGVAIAPDNAQLSLIFDNFVVHLPAGGSDARVAHGAYNFALPKKATGFKAALRGFQQLEARANATLHISVGRAAKLCRFPSAKIPNGEFLLELNGKFDEAIDAGRLAVLIALSGINLAEKGDGQITVDSLDIALDVA